MHNKDHYVVMTWRLRKNKKMQSECLVLRIVLKEPQLSQAGRQEREQGRSWMWQGRESKRKAFFLLRHETVDVLFLFTFLKGIAPITVVTHRDTLCTEEDCKNALEEGSAATGSSLRHTFLVSNYTRCHKERQLEIEKMVFDILHHALKNAEQAVKIMKLKEKSKQVDEMMKAMKEVTVSGQVTPYSSDGKFSLCAYKGQNLWMLDFLLSIYKQFYCISQLVRAL